VPLIALGFTSFAAFGVALVLIGANQPELAAALSLDLSGSALLAAALSLGLGVGVIGSGPLVDRFPRRPLFVAAALLAGLGLLGISTSMSLIRALACLAASGVGLGAIETLLNSLITERYLERSARPLAFVHIGATVGAVLGPLALQQTNAWVGWTSGFHATGVAWVGIAAVALALRFASPPHASRASARSALLPAIAPFALVAICYVGVETALTLLALPYAAALDLVPTRGGAAISSFWLGLLAGRLVLMAHRGRPDARLLAAYGALGAIVIGGATLLRVPQIELAVGLMGVALGGTFPLMVALAAERFPQSRGTATGIVVGAGAIGGLLVPWTAGAIGDANGALVGIASLAPWCLLMAGAALLTRRAS
jgi:fucose permease